VFHATEPWRAFQNSPEQFEAQKSMLGAECSLSERVSSIYTIKNPDAGNFIKQTELLALEVVATREKLMERSIFVYFIPSISLEYFLLITRPLNEGTLGDVGTQETVA